MIEGSWQDGQIWSAELDVEVDIKLESEQQRLVKEEWQLRESEWRLWIDKALEGAAGKAHRFAKVKDLQQHKLAENSAGQFSLGITYRLSEQAGKWSRIWKDRGKAKERFGGSWRRN